MLLSSFASSSLDDAPLSIFAHAEPHYEDPIRDPLTGLFNRRFLDEMLNREWRRALRDVEAISVLRIDVDHLRFFNRCHGRALGDVALRRIGKALEATLTRGGDLVARHSDGHFIAVLPRTPAAGAAKAAEAVRVAVSSIDLAAAGHDGIGLTVSVGVATAEGLTLLPGGWVTCMTAAQAALREAKAAGGDRVLAA